MTQTGVAHSELPGRFLIGGGRDEEALRPLYARFLAACPVARPRVGCLVVDEGDGPAQFERFAASLRGAGDCTPAPMLVPLGGSWDAGSLDGVDGLLVCAGLTPAYRQVLAPVAAAVRQWMASGRRPYAGFSAGAAVAAESALAGGFRVGGRPVCPDDAGEDLEPVTVGPGLGLTPLTIDVHCAQWGTLSRLVAAVSAGNAPVGVALDENTMLELHSDSATVHGAGHAWLVSARDGAVTVHRHVAGDHIPWVSPTP